MKYSLIKVISTQKTQSPCHITAGGSRFFFIILETVNRIFKITNVELRLTTLEPNAKY